MTGDEVEWDRLEADLNDTPPIDDDSARHVMLGIMTGASTIGLGREVWDALVTAVPKVERMLNVDDHNMPDVDSLEWLRLNDILLDAVPVAEAWLQDWLLGHGVPFIVVPVMCPSHGLFMYVLGDPKKIVEAMGPTVHNGLNLIRSLD